MLEVMHLTKKYRKTLAVDDVSFSVPDGSIGILLGPEPGNLRLLKALQGF